MLTVIVQRYLDFNVLYAKSFFSSKNSSQDIEIDYIKTNWSVFPIEYSRVPIYL